jgi:hypothetical protein
MQAGEVLIMRQSVKTLYGNNILGSTLRILVLNVHECNGTQNWNSERITKCTMQGDTEFGVLQWIIFS